MYQMQTTGSLLCVEQEPADVNGGEISVSILLVFCFVLFLLLGLSHVV